MGVVETEEPRMKYMLLMNYRVEGVQPMSTWEPEDITAHIDFQIALNKQLTESGELLDAQALAGSEQARIVTFDGRSAPVVTDGPFPESKELLAGYRLVDVETAGRAIEIAAQASAAPGPNGVPVRQPIEVREVLSAPDPEV
jgi:hypothetical protein